MNLYYMKNKLSVAVILIAAVLISSCTSNFEELNLHPTDPTASDMTASESVGSLFPTMIAAMHLAQENQNQHIHQMVGNQYGGYMVTTNNWQGTNFGTYNPSKDWVDIPFDDIMVDFNSNFIQVKEVTEGGGYVYAWANILRVATMLRVTDMYGPIPYSKIGEGGITTSYDDVQAVYHYMIEDLNNSVSSLNSYLSDTPERSPLADYDVVYNGDFSKWIKFANSLKLRMAVRIASVDTEYAKNAMEEAIEGGLIEENNDNAFIPTEDNPYYKASHSWGDLAVSAELSAFMSGFEDPRCAAYMTPVTMFGTGYTGVRMGINGIAKDVYSTAAFFSKPAFAQDSPLLVFCAAETAFLKSEAALQGWIAGGDDKAKEMYEKGVQLSMNQHGVEIGTYLESITEPATYKDNIGRTEVSVENKITVAWDDAGTSENTKLEKIITQKWLANYPLGFESWCDHRRTGFPQFFPAQDNLSSSGFIGDVDNSPSRRVRRLPFPQSQYQGNSAAVQEAVQMLGGDDVASTDLWWAKKL